jgi:hypothetical protein
MRAAMLAVVLGVLSSAASRADELIANGGMEPPFGDGMPHGWQKNCWGKNTVTFSPGEPHRGTSSLKVACTAFETGAVQFLCPRKVVGGRHYRISLWMRAQGGVGSVGVRTPYTLVGPRLSLQRPQYTRTAPRCKPLHSGGTPGRTVQAY